MRRSRPRAPARKPAGEYHHGDLRQALLDAALQILGESGADGFTLREAARRVGVDHRAAYRHFADRDAVLAAVASEGYRALLEAIRRALDGLEDAGGHVRLLAIARAYVAFAVGDPARYRVMTGPRLNDEGRFAELEGVLDEAFAFLKAEISSGVASGTLSRVNPAEAGIALWAAVHGLASLVIMRRFRVRKGELLRFTDRSIGYLVSGLER